MENKRLFSNRQLARLIFPLVIEQALNILVSLADGVMVPSVGKAAISSVSLVDMFNANVAQICKSVSHRMSPFSINSLEILEN